MNTVNKLTTYLNNYPGIMDSSFPFIDPNAKFDVNNPLLECTRLYHGNTSHGKLCTLIDNTGLDLPEAECRDILTGLIANDLFGFRSLSPQGGDTIQMDRRESSHVQVGAELYRLIVFRYEARIELF